MEECGGLTYSVVQVTELSTAIKEPFTPHTTFYVNLLINTITLRQLITVLLITFTKLSVAKTTFHMEIYAHKVKFGGILVI